jgi:hypothetical protein
MPSSQLGEVRHVVAPDGESETSKQPEPVVLGICRRRMCTGRPRITRTFHSATPPGHACLAPPSVYSAWMTTPRCSYHWPHEDLSLKRKRSTVRATRPSVQFSRRHRSGVITNSPKLVPSDAGLSTKGRRAPSSCLRSASNIASRRY